MKIYTKIILDKNNKVLKEEFFEYSGTMAFAGIHYDFKSQKGNKLMEKQAKREKKLAERRAKKQSKQETNESEDKSIPIDQVVTLEHLTNPEKK